MTSQIAAKQINKFLSAFLGIASVSVTSASSVSITTPLTSVLATAGDGGVSVPAQQASATQMGVVSSGNNVVQVWDATTLQPLMVAGNEVYGRVTFTSPGFAVAFFTEVAGVETAATINQSVKLAVPYRFDLANLPQDSLVVWSDLAPGAAAGTGGIPVNEPLTVTGNNAFANLANTPINPSTAIMTVNGLEIFAGTHFSIAGKSVTISTAQSNAIGYAIATTDSCVMKYRY